MSELGPTAARYQIVGVDVGADRIRVTYVDPTREVPGLTEISALEVDPALCETEAIELLDAIEAFIDAADLARRNPPDSIAGRVRR